VCVCVCARACVCVQMTKKWIKKNKNYFNTFWNFEVFLCSLSFLLFSLSTYYSNFAFYIQFNIVTFFPILSCHGMFFYQKTNVQKEKLISHFFTYVRIPFNSLIYHILRKYKLYMFHYHMYYTFNLENAYQ